jgi:hypothetical protein
MTEATFDDLLRQVSRQTTRRAAAATLLGGALLLHTPMASNANKEAQRRKDHRRQQSNTALLRPISVQVHNPGTNPVTLQHGTWYRSEIVYYCSAINTVPIPPGQTLLFRSSDSVEYLWINGTYWIDFTNPALARPHVTATVDGSPFRKAASSCPPLGTTVLSARPLSEGNSVNFTIRNGVFTVTRNRDTNYKEFTLTLPTTL